MIIRNYIHKEILQKLVWIVGLLVLIFASNKFVGFLSDAAEGNLPADMVFMMLGFKLLASLPKILPIAILMSTLLVFTRMANERELIILEGSGVSKLIQLKIVAQFSFIFCLFAALVTMYAAPWAEQNIQVNSILPGYITTNMTDGFKKNFPKDADLVTSRIPDGRWGWRSR